MSSSKDRDRARLFDNKDKRKPSQPDMQGDGRIGGKNYAITAWIRDDELHLSLAPPRDGSNTYPPEEFRGVLETAPRAKKGAEGPAPVWQGDIDGEELTYAVKAFSQQGKSGNYLSLEFAEGTRKPPVGFEPEADLEVEAEL